MTDALVKNREPYC